jgi:broad specificity phosphatase PhoE
VKADFVVQKTGPKWASLEGGGIPDVGEVTWVDAKLVETGIEDAEALSRFWIDATKNYSMPLPKTIYTSPLARCLETTKLTYQDVMSAHKQPFHPVVKELLRERLTGHTCDKRSSKSWIAENYPDFVFEEGFEEDDTLWEEKKESTEELEELTARKQRLLEDIFTNDSSQVIAVTTHSYSIYGIQEAVGAEHYRVGEGVMVPLLVKGVKI